MSRLEIPASQGSRAALRVQTLGGFRVWRDGEELSSTSWGREKAIHLFQFFITERHRNLHKEQIIDQLWPELPPGAGDRDFKVALNAIHKAIEPERAPRTPPRFIRRFDLAYGLNLDDVWIDADAFEASLTAGNQALGARPDQAVEHYRTAVELYAGEFLPERRYEDWTSIERERLTTLALSGMTSLAELEIVDNPGNSLILTQRVIMLEPLWEQAYRVQMRVHQALGNRPMALLTYRQLNEVLAEELGIDPLPETQRLYEEILGEV